MLHNLGFVEGVGSFVAQECKNQVVELFKQNFALATDYLHSTKKPSSHVIADVDRLIATFNMIIADNTDIAQMMLELDFASIVTNLFNAVFAAKVKHSLNNQKIKSTYMITHFFLICTQNKVVTGLCLPQLVDFLSTIFSKQDFIDSCTTDFFNSSNFGIGGKGVQDSG